MSAPTNKTDLPATQDLEKAYAEVLGELEAVNVQVAALTQIFEAKVEALRKRFYKPHMATLEKQAELEQKAELARRTIQNALVEAWVAQGKPDAGGRSMSGAVNLRVTYRGEIIRYDEKAALVWAKKHAPHLVIESVDQKALVAGAKANALPASIMGEGGFIEFGNKASVSIEAAKLPRIEVKA